MTNNDSFQNLINDLTQQAIEKAQEKIRDDLSNIVNQKLDEIILEKIKTIDLNAMVNRLIDSRLEDTNYVIPFREKSISGKSIDSTDLTVSGDNITGGMIKNFSSVGIDDQSSSCQVTVLDQGTVFENTLYAPRIEVKGGAVVDGDLTILGTITDNTAYQQIVQDASAKAQTEIGPAVLDAYQDRVFERIQQEGLDLSKIKINGQSIVENDTLTGAVRHSQLQSLGVIRDLQTDGEALISQTLYVSNRRVGINTMDPNATLSIWDEEIEIGVGKESQGVARIGTARDQVLILGANKKNNITLTPDGVTAIPKLQLGNMLFGTSAFPPNYDAPKGTVVFNEIPSLGGPLGWVSLGSACWANFGIID
jgi:hypothetical protein